MDQNELTILIMNKFNIDSYNLAKKIALDCIALDCQKKDLLYGKYDELIINILMPKYKKND